MAGSRGELVKADRRETLGSVRAVWVWFRSLAPPGVLVSLSPKPGLGLTHIEESWGPQSRKTQNAHHIANGSPTLGTKRDFLQQREAERSLWLATVVCASTCLLIQHNPAHTDPCISLLRIWEVKDKHSPCTLCAQPTGRCVRLMVYQGSVGGPFWREASSSSVLPSSWGPPWFPPLLLRLSARDAGCWWAAVSPRWFWNVQNRTLIQFAWWHIVPEAKNTLSVSVIVLNYV